jgi:2-iminobutanoate/2-iminopropanoate deaminase
MKKIISTDKAPAAVGPYNQAVEAGGFVFCSGQVPLDPNSKDKKLVGETATEQAEQVLENVKAILESQGLGMKDVVKATVFAVDINDFQAVNEVYGRYFETDPPARSFFQVGALPLGARVEVEVIAYKG